jgi:hypothetical protein
VEQVKKELFEASLLAVALAAGIGTISYALFAETPPVGKLEPVLDVYTANSGIGINASSGAFEPGDIVPVYAYLTAGGVRVNASQVTFTVRRPNGTETVRTALTNGSGVAEIPLSFLPSEGHLVGAWQILANASVNNEAADDMMTLQCKSENARIDVFSKKNGAVSISFLPGDEVFLEARMSYRNASIADAPVTFEVKTPNDTDLLSPARKTISTDRLGTANLTFQIPWPSSFSLGTWHATATSQIYEQNVNITTEFHCKLVPPVIDVCTQKGGQGPNMPGGTYMLNESVRLYAEIRGSLNQTLPNNLVSFEFKFFNVTSVPWTEAFMVCETNASGIANATIRIPPIAEYAGTWAVYATVQYNDTVLIDTLIFMTTQ